MSLSFRIIAGELGGRMLKAPKDLPVRPTKNQVKESLFNILQHSVSLKELRVLDLFCGLGSVSLEFASRGALVTSIDKDPGCVKFVSGSAEKLNANVKTEIADAFEFLAKDKLAFDLIFADPPYHIELEDYQSILEGIFSEENDFNGLFVLEHSAKMKVDELEHCTDSRRYGSTCISFFER